MTPLNNATSVAEQRYNRAHVKTRNTIERAFGLLKMRFRCLHRTGGCLQSSPSTCAKIITACAVLHNICIDKAVPAPEEDNTVTDTPDVTDDATDTTETQLVPDCASNSSPKDLCKLPDSLPNHRLFITYVN